jgi:hypothetical protein
MPSLGLGSIRIIDGLPQCPVCLKPMAFVGEEEHPSGNKIPLFRCAECGNEFPSADIRETSKAALSALPEWKPSPRQVLASANANSRSYDEIGFHICSLSQRSGHSPLVTLANVESQLKESERPADDVVASGVFSRLKEGLAHRAIDIPRHGHFRYEIVGSSSLRLTAIDEQTGDEQEWMYSLARPPRGIAEQAQESDVPPLVAQHITSDVPGICWLPLTALIGSGRHSPNARLGRFTRDQDCARPLLHLRIASMAYCDPPRSQWASGRATCLANVGVPMRGNLYRTPTRASCTASLQRWYESANRTYRLRACRIATRERSPVLCPRRLAASAIRGGPFYGRALRRQRIGCGGWGPAT